MSRFRKQWGLLPAVLVVAVAALVLWAGAATQPIPRALAAREPDAQGSVSTATWLVFRPHEQEPTTGLVLYPGGRVGSQSYAPPARAIAEEGYMVAIVPMPLSLAFRAISWRPSRSMAREMDWRQKSRLETRAPSKTKFRPAVWRHCSCGLALDTTENPLMRKR
jgi:hypothetical protein